MSLGPLVFEPYLRPQIWGGRALGTKLGKNLPTSDAYGESWEISGHPHHVSIIAEGPHFGESLNDIAETDPVGLYGDAVPADGKFPLLIKFLDCHELLSVQVHPDDEKASRLLPGEKGKTEAWVVLDAEPNGVIYAGLKPGTDKATFEKHIEAKTTDQCLHQFHPQAGDCVFIPAGTIHTMGGGVLIAEVQQSSDATFRIFDWNRVDKDGKGRPLHVPESVASIDFAKGPVAPVIPTPMGSGERLVSSPFFAIDRFTVSELANPFAGRFSIWMVAAGRVRLIAGDFEREFAAGQTVLLPASCPIATWKSTKNADPAKLLAVTLPARSN